MDPIERVSDAVAALVGRDMTREDCHQFILEAAQMMEPVKPIIIGGSDQGCATECVYPPAQTRQ